ncbi:MAG: hypothetical protein V3R73_04145 [Sphingomonadales bacterium]
MGNFFHELKRRSVVRVGAAYLIVGWIILQFVGEVGPILDLPDWFPKAILLLLGVGFPAVLLFAWSFELTSKGIQLDEDVDPALSPDPGHALKLDRIIIAGLVIALAYFAWDKFLRGPGEEPEAPAPTETAAEPADQVALRSIAVLPFVNMSSDPEQEYFSDGISEEILNVLARVPDLHVTSRSSAFSFKGKNVDIPTVAKQLGVAHVLEGSVRKSGVRVRITAQLIEAATDKHLWSATYDRELDDIFAIQDEIAAAIVAALVERLNLAPTAVPKVRAAANSEAYDAYLLGIHHMEQRGGGPLSIAAEQFEKALQIDPGYVPAMARLSMTYVLLPGYDFQNNPPAELYAKALPLAEKALALAPGLPEAQAAMGFYLDQAGKELAAESYYLRALELNPSYASVQVWLARLNANLGRYDAHLAMLEAAVRIDPLSELALTNLAGAYEDRKMIGKALPIIERLRTLSPLFHASHLASMLADDRRFAEAALGQLKVLAIDRSSSLGRGGLAALLENQFGLIAETVRFNWFPLPAHIRLGEVEKALATLAAIEPLIPPDNAGFKAAVGSFHLVVGDAAKAREYLTKAWEMVPERPAKVGRYGGSEFLAMIAVKKQDGDSAGLKDLIERGFAFLDGREAANMTNSGDHWYRGWLLIYSDKAEEGLKFMRRGVEAGYGPDFMDDYIMKQFPDLDFAPIMAIFEARRDVERDKFLKAVCNGENPAPEAWTPAPETCEGYVEAGG